MGDDDLISFATEFREGILDGDPSDLMCAAVCWPLAALLRNCGVQCETVETKDVETDFGSVNLDLFEQCAAALRASLTEGKAVAGD